MWTKPSLNKQKAYRKNKNTQHINWYIIVIIITIPLPCYLFAKSRCPSC